MSSADTLYEDLSVVENEHGVRVTIKVVPGSSRTRLAGVYGHALKVTVSAAPEKGKANKELLHFLAGKLKVAKNRLAVVSGQTNPHKDVQIDGVNREGFIKRLIDAQ